MNRLDFINKFNETFKTFSFQGDEHGVIHNLHLDLDEDIVFKGKSDFELDVTYVFQHFKSFFTTLGIRGNLFENIHCVVSEDYMAYEDNDKYEKEKLRAYVVSFNLNEVYDAVVHKLSQKHQKQKVFRVEVPSGEGLFGTIGSAVLKHNEFCLPPHEDGNLSYLFIGSLHSHAISLQKLYSDQWFFGFKSLKGIRDWFPKQAQIERLVKAGCVVKEFEVDEVYAISGGHQVAFVKDKAMLIKEYPLSIKHKQNSKVGNKLKFKNGSH